LTGLSESIQLGGVTTGTPTIHQGKIYLGIQGPTPFGDTGHAIIIIDSESMTEEDRAPTPGFVQSEMVLTNSMEKGGTLYLYMTYNQLPGGIYVMEIGEDAGKKSNSGFWIRRLFQPTQDHGELWDFHTGRR
jgi:hypothetical protein